MKIVVSGSRNITDERAVERILSYYIATKDTVITGGCRGVDLIAEDYARRYFNHIVTLSADWYTHGKAAGPIRNREMAQMADQLIAIWDGKSRGTKNMIGEAFKCGVETHVHFIEVNT